MNAHPAVRQAVRAVVACYGHKGHDFRNYPSGTNGRRDCKRTTRRSSRRLDKAICGHALSF